MAKAVKKANLKMKLKGGQASAAPPVRQAKPNMV